MPAQDNERAARWTSPSSSQTTARRRKQHSARVRPEARHSSPPPRKAAVMGDARAWDDDQSSRPGLGALLLFDRCGNELGLGRFDDHLSDARCQSGTPRLERHEGSRGRARSSAAPRVQRLHRGYRGFGTPGPDQAHSGPIREARPGHRKDRHRAFIGPLRAMARPGLEPGTPRSQAGQRGVELPRNACT